MICHHHYLAKQRECLISTFPGCKLLGETQNEGNAFANFTHLENPQDCANLCVEHRTSATSGRWTTTPKNVFSLSQSQKISTWEVVKILRLEIRPVDAFSNSTLSTMLPAFLQGWTVLDLWGIFRIVLTFAHKIPIVLTGRWTVQVGYALSNEAEVNSLEWKDLYLET